MNGYELLIVLLGVVSCITIWFGVGFISFLIGIKYDKNITEFNDEIKEACGICICCGLLTFVIVLYTIIKDEFYKWMNNFIKNR